MRRVPHSFSTKSKICSGHSEAQCMFFSHTGEDLVPQVSECDKLIAIFKISIFI